MIYAGVVPIRSVAKGILDLNSEHRPFNSSRNLWALTCVGKMSAVNR
jgi:hypothetical protein